MQSPRKFQRNSEALLCSDKISKFMYIYRTAEILDGLKIKLGILAKPALHKHIWARKALH